VLEDSLSYPCQQRSLAERWLPELAPKVDMGAGGRGGGGGLKGWAVDGVAVGGLG
jgi:hypothetical protein